MLARSAAQNPVWCFSCFAQVPLKKSISKEDLNDVAGIQPGAGGGLAWRCYDNAGQISKHCWLKLGHGYGHTNCSLV